MKLLYITDDVAALAFIWGERIFAYEYPCSGREKSGTGIFKYLHYFAKQNSRQLFSKKGPIRSQKSKKFKESVSSFGSVNGILLVRI